MNQISSQELAPPSAIDVEEIVLGSMLLEKKATYLGVSLLSADAMYKHEHRIIFSAIKSAYKSGAVDLITVTNELRKSGELESVGGASAISQLTSRVASTANLEYHCRILLQQQMKRGVIQHAAKYMRQAYSNDADPFDMVMDMAKDLHAINSGIAVGKSKGIEDYKRELTEQVMKLQDGIVPGVSTGIQKYDKNTGGQHPGELIIYGGRPGMGKTARACNEIYHQLSQGKKVIFHSLEMTGSQILARLIGLHVGMPPGDILKYKIDLDLFNRGMKWDKLKNLHILEDSRMQSIVMETAMISASSGCDIVYVDYVQLIRAGFQKPYENVSEASRQLKQLAKTHSIPVVALAQLSRSVETRGGDKIPILSDLKESGQIEQDADVVEFLYRPEYYGIEHTHDGQSTAGKIYYINAKCRSGRPGVTVELDWNGEMNKISEPGYSSQFPNEKKDPFKSILNEPF